MKSIPKPTTGPQPTACSSASAPPGASAPSGGTGLAAWDGVVGEGKRIGTLHADALPVVIPESVLEQILEYSEQDLRRELGGFLIGCVSDAGAARIEVRHFLPAVDARSRVASLTFTHETWAQLHREMEARFSGQILVGWHHTHPDLGVFLSGYDLFIHRHFFPHRWQVALVLDPVRHEFSFFQWRGDDVADCGFICVADQGPARGGPSVPAGPAR